MRLLELLARSLRAAAQRSPVPRSRLFVEQLEARVVPYSVSGNAWSHPELVTLSFVPDGTVLGSNANGYIYSNLFATFNAKFGSSARWQNQILKAAQVWAQQTNLNFGVVSDNGSAIGSGLYQQGDPGMGDIRIGGYNFGTSTLSQTYMPPPVNNYSVAGDMQFNTGQAFNIGSTYDLFTVAEHEMGHALGLYHTSIISAVMYSSYNGMKAAPASDDIAGIRNIYSNNNPRSPDSYDAAVSNDSFATATDVTSLLAPATLTAQVNNLDITTTADLDYYTVTAPSGTSNTLTVNVQSSGLSLLSPTLTVYATDQVTVLASASGLNQYGTTLSATVNGVTAGQRFYIKVAGADATAFSTGKYALTLNFGTGPSPAVPLPNTQTLNGNPLSAGGGQATKLTYETGVNTYTSGTQQTFAESPQAVAMNGTGYSVATWSSDGQDGSGWGVYAQRYDASGNPLGGEFRVNTTTTGDQQYSSVAMDAAGDFVITWSDGSGPDWDVRAQWYNAAGAPVGGEVRVNTYTTHDQMYSGVAMDAAGDTVITWSSDGQDGSGWGVYAQRYALGGVPVGGEFRVNTTTTGDQEYSSAAMDSAGNFVITWSDGSGSDWEVRAQWYNAAGVPQGGEVHVNTYTAGDQIYSSVAMDAAGDAVITWSSSAQDGSGWGVYAQRYKVLGIAQGGEFRVNTTTADDQKHSRVAMDGSGNFMITWSSYNQDSPASWGVYGQQYNATGGALGTEFQVNTTTAGDQRYSSVAMGGNGQAVVVWSGNGLGDADGVFAQRYAVNASSGLSNLSVDSFPDPDFVDPGRGEGDGTDPAVRSGVATAEQPHTTILSPPRFAWLGRLADDLPRADEGGTGMPFSISGHTEPMSQSPSWLAALPVDDVRSLGESTTPSRSGLRSWSKSCDACFARLGWTEDGLVGLGLDDEG